MRFAPGPKTRQEADHLTELARQVAALRRIAGVPPVSVSRGADGQPVIGLARPAFSGARAVYVNLSVAQTVPTGADTAVTFNADASVTTVPDPAAFDAGDYFDLAASDRLTAPQNGFYAVGGMVWFQASGGGTVRRLKLQVTAPVVGTQNVAVAAQPPVTGVTYPTVLTVNAVVYLPAGGYVRLLAFQDSGSALNISTTSPLEPPAIWAAQLAADTPDA